MDETLKRAAYGVGVAAVLAATLAAGKMSPGLAMTLAPGALAALNAMVRKWRGGEVHRTDVATQALPGTALGALGWYLMG